LAFKTRTGSYTTSSGFLKSYHNLLERQINADEYAQNYSLPDSLEINI
jgi:hypothetical protein